MTDGSSFRGRGVRPGPNAESDPVVSRRRFHAAAVVTMAGAGLAACQAPVPRATPTEAGLPSRRAMAGGGDWLDSVRIEHRAVDAAFAQLLAAGEPALRVRLRTALADMLTVHAVQEETVLYPALAMAGLKAEPQQLYADHAQIKVLLAELDVLPKDHPAWPARVENLRAIVLRHMQEEESKIYPSFRAALSPDQNALVTARYRAEGEKFAPRS
ncbi:MAG: hemerythrin domain-containing protein [Burkholderiales bacterium]|nr:MAG: hemerythrin domain-containing protein [Burkholderiales bacterium]